MSVISAQAIDYYDTSSAHNHWAYPVAKTLETLEYDPYGRSKRTKLADYNHNGTVEAQDLFDGMAAYFANDRSADFDDNGIYDSSDFSPVFFNDYFATDSTAIDALSISWIDNPYGYCGYYADVETRGINGDRNGFLYHCRHREYDPISGRWLQRDPAGFIDGMNLYQYVAGRATGAIDPMGLTFWEGVKQVVRGVVNALVNSPANPAYVPMKAIAYARDPSGEFHKDVDQLKGAVTAPYNLGQDIGKASYGADNEGYDLTPDEKATAHGRAVAQIIIIGVTDGLVRGVGGRAGSGAAAEGEAAGGESGVGGRAGGEVAGSGNGDVVGTNHNTIRPTQDYVDPATVASYEFQLRSGQPVDPVHTVVTPKGEFIIDGHHRYVAGQRSGIPVPIKSLEGGGPIGFPDWSGVSYQPYQWQEPSMQCR